MSDIILAGFGGQGILTAGIILIEVAANVGKNVSWTSSYGAEMRGGTASCSVLISDDEIGSPYPTKLDILVAMNEPSYEKFSPSVKDGGIIIINSSLVNISEIPKNVRIFAVNATGMSNEIGNSRGANIVMLGAMIKATSILEKDIFRDGLDEYFSKKGKDNSKNIECYEIGYNNTIEK